MTKTSKADLWWSTNQEAKTANLIKLLRFPIGLSFSDPWIGELFRSTDAIARLAEHSYHRGNADEKHKRQKDPAIPPVPPAGPIDFIITVALTGRSSKST